MDGIRHMQKGKVTEMDDLSDDMLQGAESIAAYLGKEVRQTYHLLERRIIRGWKWGNVWHARKSTLRRDIEKLEEGAST